MDKPLISIITPVYNAGNTISKTILSVANQKYNNLEHVLINNCSTDSTFTLIETYKQRFDHLRSITEKDSGIYHAMNKGIDQSNGDWLLFLGADDELYNDHVLSDLHEMGLFSQDRIIYGNVLINGHVSWAAENSIYDGKFDLKKLLTRNICHQAIFYPKKIFDEFGRFNINYRITADWDFNLRCFAKKEFVYSDIIISVFSGGGTSTRQVHDNFSDDFIKNIVNYFNLELNDSRLDDKDHPLYALLYRYFGENMMKWLGDYRNSGRGH